MESTFGARLRAQRERQQVALATIANQTKIRVSLLEELEKDDVTHWPHGIFRRSYVRSYALAIGLEPDAVAREFLELYPDTLDYTPEAVAAARGIDVQTAKQSPPTRLKFLLHSAFEALPALRAEPATARTPPAESAPAAEVHRAPAAAKSEPQPAPLPEPSAPAAARSEPPSPAATTESAPAPPASTPPAIEPPSVAPPAVESPAIEPPAEHQPAGVNLSEVARLCTRLGCARDVDDVLSLLEEAVGVFEAVGLTLWIADDQNWLTAVLAHGYQNGLARLPQVPGDAHNAVALAYRSAAICVVDGHGASTGAIAVPIITAAGCAGVLALELPHRREQRECVRAAAMIVAAQLSTLIASPSLVCASPSVARAATA